MRWRRNPMPGRPARSVELRLIEGTKTDDVELNRPIAPESSFPDPPVWFQPEAEKVYRNVIRRLGELRVGSEVDTDMVVSYVMGISILRECERAFAKVGVARSKKYRVWESTQRRVHAMARELGLTPAARSGMRITPNEVPEPATKDLFAS
jgi:P27 family predicted phage terminase small subunit